ncbi:hypothetical protein DFH06DRAFT_1338183 [Mycena polygramma]|nr:hypothetical protein DFH06DRAFT_1338183 [Mycena polygramma]
MPLLRHLEVLADRGPSIGVVLHEVPLLRTVVLNDAVALWVTCPWAQLTSLTLRNIYFFECVPILVQTHNLIHCELEIFGRNANNAEFQDISLPCLESLAIVHSGGPPATEFLGPFVVPALRSLMISEFFLSPDPI